MISDDPGSYWFRKGVYSVHVVGETGFRCKEAFVSITRSGRRTYLCTVPMHLLRSSRQAIMTPSKKNGLIMRGGSHWHPAMRIS